MRVKQIWSKNKCVIFQLHKSHLGGGGAQTLFLGGGHVPPPPPPTVHPLGDAPDYNKVYIE